MKKIFAPIFLMLVCGIIGIQAKRSEKLQDRFLSTNKTCTYNVNGVDFNMVRVAGGSYMMGAQGVLDSDFDYEAVADIDEVPVNKVTLNSYYMAETEVTQALWNAVGMESDDLNWTCDLGLGDDYPAYNLNIDQAQIFIDSLNAKLHRSGAITLSQKFALPTEAQWEFAAKGGNKSEGYLYSGSNNFSDVAWSKTEGAGLHTVKGKAPNELGLYDMSGNVYEICADNYDKTKSTNTMRVAKGGSWCNYEDHCRPNGRQCTLPFFGSPDGGMRLVLLDM